MIVVEIMISNGEETNRFRDIAADVLQMLNHLFNYEMRADIVLRNWDYRLDAPRVVPDGDLAARSLGMVDRSEGVLAIFGSELPDITCQEVRRSLEARRNGGPHRLWVFVDSTRPSVYRSRFFDDLRDEFGEEIQYAQYSSELEFQARAFITLTSFTLERLRINLVNAEYLQ